MAKILVFTVLFLGVAHGQALNEIAQGGHSMGGEHIPELALRICWCSFLPAHLRLHLSSKGVLVELVQFVRRISTEKRAACQSGFTLAKWDFARRTRRWVGLSIAIA